MSNGDKPVPLSAAMLDTIESEARSGHPKRSANFIPADVVVALVEMARASASETEPKFLLWQSRVDCWYAPHRDPGAKVKPNVQVPVFVMLEAPDSETAIKRALEWADSNAPRSKGRKLVSIEHRSTGPVRLPLEVNRE